jgi:hypothetical protein
MAYDGELRGVAGWLALFVAILAAISPLLSVVQVYIALYREPMAPLVYGDLWPTVQGFEWALVVVTTLIGWFCAYRLLNVQNWTSVRIAIAGVWTMGVGSMVVETIGILYFTGADFGDLVSAGGPAFIIRPFIFGLVWTAYLLKSRRVENTYRGVEEQTEVFE